LSGHAQCVANLLPGPSLRPRNRDVAGFDPFGESVQSERRTKAQCRIFGIHRFGEVRVIHNVSLP